MMYFEGHGVPRDVRQAVLWYERAADHGDAIARFSLGSIYDTGADGVAPDPVKAAAWYRKAAERGFAIGQYRLGLMYRDGRGMARNQTQAMTWFRKAADQGDADAQIELGILLSPGQGPSTDIVHAHMWLNLAASRWKDEAKRVKASVLRDELEKTMTPQQRVEAYRRATEWQDAHSWQRQSAASPGTR
jgi:TPR repeat protein